MSLTPEAYARLDEFHRTPVSSVLGNRPPQWEPWEAVSARYREAYAAEQAAEPRWAPARQRREHHARLRLTAEAARRAQR